MSSSPASSSFGGHSSEDSVHRGHITNPNVANHGGISSPQPQIHTGQNRLSLERQDVHRRQRGPTERYRRERELAHTHTSPKDLLHLLVDHEYEATRLRKALYTAFERLEAESQRAAEAERGKAEMLAHFRQLNESRVKALQEATRANEALAQYQLQYQNAQREIERAQIVLKRVEEQRDEAETSAARARTLARELNQQRLVASAREEGRRLGFEAGFRRAQRELGIIGTQGITNSDRERYEADIDQAMLDAERDYLNGEGAQDDYYYHDNHEDGERLRSDDHEDIVGSPEVIRLRTPGPSMPQPRFPPPPEPVPVTQPVPEPAPVPIPPPGMRTPDVQIYSLPIPPAEQLERGNVNPIIRHNQFEMPSSSVLPPDNFIPPSDQSGHIPIPPPFGFSHPTSIPPPSPHSPSINLPPIPVELVPRPDSKNSAFRVPPRTSSSHSRRNSTGSSTSTRLSQIDIVREREPEGGTRPRTQRELSVIREDDGSRLGTPAHTHRSQSLASKSSFGRGESGSPMFADPFASGSGSAGQRRRVENEDRQRAERRMLANELRYSNPGEADEWKPGPEPSRDRPPRHIPRPANLTTPAPLSPSGSSSRNRGHMRSTSDVSSVLSSNSQPKTHRPVMSNSSSIYSLGRAAADIYAKSSNARNTGHQSNDSGEVNIQVETPSTPAASAVPPQDYFSSHHASGPIPIHPLNVQPRSPSLKNPSLVPTAPNSPTQPSLQWPAAPHRPLSRPSSSAAQVPFPSASQTSLGHIPNGRQRAASRAGSVSSQKQGAVTSNAELEPSTSRVSLTDRAHAQSEGHTLHRVESNASLESSYSKYDPSTYLDPAYYGPERDTNARSKAGPSGSVRAKPRSRNVSMSSELEYIDR